MFQLQSNQSVRAAIKFVLTFNRFKRIIDLERKFNSRKCRKSKMKGMYVCLHFFSFNTLKASTWNNTLKASTWNNACVFYFVKRETLVNQVNESVYLRFCVRERESAIVIN